jgi:hypothetical protein
MHVVQGARHGVWGPPPPPPPRADVGRVRRLEFTDVFQLIMGLEGTPVRLQLARQLSHTNLGVERFQKYSLLPRPPPPLPSPPRPLLDLTPAPTPKREAGLTCAAAAAALELIRRYNESMPDVIRANLVSAGGAAAPAAKARPRPLSDNRHSLRGEGGWNLPALQRDPGARERQTDGGGGGGVGPAAAGLSVSSLLTNPLEAFIPRRVQTLSPDAAAAPRRSPPASGPSALFAQATETREDPGEYFMAL